MSYINNKIVLPKRYYYKRYIDRHFTFVTIMHNNYLLLLVLITL